MPKKREWLKELREFQEYSINGIAREVDVTPQFYWYIENGKRRPSPELAQKIAKLLGFDWKLFYEDKQAKE